MGVARCNKSTGGDMLASRAGESRQLARKSDKLEQLKQTNLNYLLLASSCDNKSLASTSENEDDEGQEEEQAGGAADESDRPARRRPLLQRFNIEDELFASCYVWPDAARLATSSPMLHESLRLAADGGPAACSLSSLAAELRGKSGDEEKSATRRRRKRPTASRQSEAKWRAKAEGAKSATITQQRWRLRRRPLRTRSWRSNWPLGRNCDCDCDCYCDSDDHCDCEPQVTKVPHHASGQLAVAAARMPHNRRETIDAARNCSASSADLLQPPPPPGAELPLERAVQLQLRADLGEAVAPFQQAAAQPGQQDEATPAAASSSLLNNGGQRRPDEGDKLTDGRESEGNWQSGQQDQEQAHDAVKFKFAVSPGGEQAASTRDMGVHLDRLVDTCATSWRRGQANLLGSYSHAAGSYKVAQLQLESACGVAPDKQQPTASTSNSGRLARPGRSPVSLQRQTNARLARHRLKIQQQRQEQLANLARRERHQSANSTSFRPSSQAGEQLEIEVLASECATQEAHQAPRSLIDHSFAHFKSLITKLAAPASRRQSLDLPAVAPQETRVALAHLDGQWPARSPPPIWRAQHRQTIASSSSGSQVCAVAVEQPISGPPARLQRDLAQVLAQANVIVHRSPADLLRDGGGQPARQQASQQQARRPDQRRQFQFQFHQMSNQSGGGKGPAGDQRDAPDDSSSSASSTLSLNKPFCKICHLSSSKHGDKLISPCKCSGTLQHIHCGCLLKWLEISNRANEKQPMSCELCAHEYTWHKRFNFKRMKLPLCSLKDLLLHTLFVLALGVMLFCALAPIFNSARSLAAEEVRPIARPGSSLSFADQDMMSASARRAQFRSPGQLAGAASGRLASDEKFILLCAACFFVAFFVAIYAQTKARDTLYGLIVKFAHMNLTYYITEYDHGQQQQPQTTSKSDHCNRLRNPTDDNNRDLSQYQPTQAHQVQVRDGARVLLTSDAHPDAAPSNTTLATNHKSHHHHQQRPFKGF